jgi:hypothetical protein
MVAFNWNGASMECCQKKIPIFYPQSIAIDSNDYMYLSGNHEIERYRVNNPTDPTCNSKADDDICFITKWSASIGKVAVDSKGYVYAYSSSGVKKYTSQGVLVKDFGPLHTERATYDFFYPGDIAIGKEDHVYIDENCGWIVKYTSDGEYVTRWGETTDRGGISTSSGRFLCD